MTQNRRILVGCIFAFVTQLIWIYSNWQIAHSFRMQWQTLFFISRCTFWLSVLLLWLYARQIEKTPLLLWSEKRLTPKLYILSPLALLVATFVGGGIISTIITHSGLSGPSQKIKLLEQMPFLPKLFGVLTAAIAEELIFRGYLQSRLQRFFKSPWPAILISSFFFGLLHAGYGTLINMIVPLYIGILFSWYYQRYRNITVLMITHFLIDAISLFAHK